MQRSLLALAALALCPVAAAQTWSKTLDNIGWIPWAVPVTERADQVWVAAGTGLLHLDVDGSVLNEWDAGQVIADVQAAADGSLLLCGFYSGAWIARFDAAGQLDWSRRVEPAGYWEDAALYQVEATADGGALAIGARIFIDATYEDDWGEILLCRFDGTGALVWDLRVGDFSDMSYFAGTDVEELADGSAFFVGRGWAMRTLCGRVSADGQLLWLKRIGNDLGGFWPRVGLSPDGTLFATDNLRQVVRMDADGAPLWKRRFLDNLVLDGITATPDGGCVVTGTIVLGNDPMSDLFTAKLTAGGDLEWQVVHGLAQHDRGRNVAISSSGGILVAGTLPIDSRAIVQRLDAGGGAPGCEVVPGFTQLEVVTKSNDPITEPSGPAGDPVLLNAVSLVSVDLDSLDVCPSRAIGARYCDPAVPNSTGLPAELWVAGEASVAANIVTLVAHHLPPGQFGYFLVGMGTGVVNPPGSQGDLCLIGSTIHRYSASPRNAGTAGAFGLAIDLKTIPGHGKVQAGETWNFQAWYRDVNPTTTSNFTDAVAVTFVP